MNDIWQGPSWASMEYGGRWKPLHYTIRRTFAPVVTSIVRENNYVNVYAVNDRRTDITIDNTVSLMDWTNKGSDGKVIFNDLVVVQAGSSKLVASFENSEFEKLLTLNNCSSQACYLKASSYAVETE